jgi:hypothetical protein
MIVKGYTKCILHIKILNDFVSHKEYNIVANDQLELCSKCKLIYIVCGCECMFACNSCNFGNVANIIQHKLNVRHVHTL